MSILNQDSLRFCEPLLPFLSDRSFFSKAMAREPIVFQRLELFPKPPMPRVAMEAPLFGRPPSPFREARQAGANGS
jgi:hypothetical protein